MKKRQFLRSKVILQKEHSFIYAFIYAEIAQLVEHFTRNEGVAGSSPVFGFQEMAYLRRLRQRRGCRINDKKIIDAAASFCHFFAEMFWLLIPFWKNDVL